MKTIEQLQRAIDPLPALLSAKGKRMPNVEVEFSANGGSLLKVMWQKGTSTESWEREYEFFREQPIENAIAKARDFIAALPEPELAKLREFMSMLGKTIDAGNDLGINVDYLNPLTETMKRLSENALTHQPA